MASIIGNIPTKNYQNLVSGFQVAVEKCRGCFLRQCIFAHVETKVFMSRRLECQNKYLSKHKKSWECYDCLPRS